MTGQVTYRVTLPHKLNADCVLQISVSDALHFYRSSKWTSFQIQTHTICNQLQHLQTESAGDAGYTLQFLRNKSW